MTEKGKQSLRDRMLKDNPMKNEATRIKMSNSLKGHIPWNKNMNSEEYKKHYPNGKIGGGRPKGYKHTTVSKNKMSEIRSRMLKDGTVKLGKLSLVNLEKNRERMRKNRQDPVFNQKMFKSLTVSVTKPHLKIQQILKEEGIESETNFSVLFGRIYGSVDEVITKNKIAIYVDGNYWHKFPEGRQWDRYCTTFLEKRGWIVIRLWESEINKDIEFCRNKIREAIKKSLTLGIAESIM